ncbi:maleylpyruvate isomerase N-terminal domain-containing protein [Rhodococcus sp. SGAir0479]|uniref:maleylpyruvate isomerase N-terminal domain-containing protein n=1 Tax=Rhodococcus sp. SGAir0479 TaxID=2567884 RepID=UPI0010CD12E7|nr:maleylpyruvate isomerase N-terminal domain-containing protein [Rhodococcus sp. SGAir0479]QCQ90364.1 maleylpyruvate isomerase family mycothiol-dependent enzyme [Rhodococcus sp. SGAir0479]
MDTTRLLATLRAQGEMIAATPVDALSEPVPTVPGWTVEHVVRHTGKVHQWVLAALREPADAPLSSVRRSGDMPRGADCLTAYRAALDALLEEFDRRDATDPAPTMVGPGTVAWWARRQAHEAAVHRIDVADALRAAGGPAGAALDAETAADGVDEWASVFLGRLARGGRLPDSLAGTTVHLHGTDTSSAEWHLAFGPGAVEVVREHRKGDVALRGPAQELLLTVWRRRPLAGIDAVGDVSVAHALLDSVAL